MQYHIQEATFDLPEGSFIDRSVNVLVFGDPALPFSVVITRDYFDEGGSVEQLLREQVKALSTSGKQFKELEFGTTHLPLNAPAVRSQHRHLHPPLVERPMLRAPTLLTRSRAIRSTRRSCSRRCPGVAHWS